MFGKPQVLIVVRKTGARLEEFASQMRNALDPAKVSTLVLVSKTVINFAGIRYNIMMTILKGTSGNLFVKLFWNRKGDAQKTIYKSAEQNAILINK